MTKVTCQISISLDGFVAGPSQSMDNPIGEGGMRLHEWAFATDTWNEQHGQEAGSRTADSEVAAKMMEGVGAFIMGRNMFGPGRGAWDESWRGWWGEDPPYHAPVFVLTNHAREPLVMEGGTTFHFVDGFDAALAAATDVAGDLPIDIAGGASVVRQAIAAGELDELTLGYAPVALGSGERLFDGTITPTLEIIEGEQSALATHVRYRIVR